MKTRLLVLFTIVLWGTTLIFRVPYLQKDPPVNNVAHIFLLQTLDIWEKEGPCLSNFAMKHTYAAEGDKFITYYKRYVDDVGNNYYVSHPSLTQFVAWLSSAGGLFHLNNRALMIMAMLLHLLGALLLQQIIRPLFHGSKFSVSAELIAVILYLFHPVILYLNTFHFFAESVGQLMFMMMIYVFLRLTGKNKQLNIKHLLILGVVSFLFSSAEWLGVFFTVSLLIVSFFIRKKNPVYFKAAIAIAGGSFLAVVVYLIQHLSLQDAETFMRALFIRYLERSGFFGQKYTDMGYSYSNPESYLLLFKQIIELFKGIGFIFILPLIALFMKKSSDSKSTTYRILIAALLLCCTLYLIVLFSATVTHYIYIAKWVIPLILLSVASFVFIARQFKGFFIKMSGIFILAALIVWSVVVFKQKASSFIVADNFLLKYVATIKTSAEQDEHIYCSPLTEYPATAIIWLSYMSGRNLDIVDDYNDICKNKLAAGKYIYITAASNKIVSLRGNCGD